MYFLKPIEQGLDVKFTGGIHRGCLRVQAVGEEQYSYRLKICAENESACREWARPRSFLPIASWAPTASMPRKISPGLFFPAGELGLGPRQRRSGCGRGFGTDRQHVDCPRQSAKHRGSGGGLTLQRRILLCGVGERKVLAKNPEGHCGCHASFAQGRKMGRSQSCCGCETIGGEKISRLHRRTEHGGDFASALCPERFRR